MFDGKYLFLSALSRGVLLGLGAAAPIGPVNVQIARRTLRDGFLAGVALGAGAVSVDVGYAILSSVSVGSVADNPWVVRPLAAAGVILLAYLGAMSLRAAYHALRVDPLMAQPARNAEPEQRNDGSGAAGLKPAPALASISRRPAYASAYLTGLLMTLFNPMTLAFWFTAVPGQITKERGGDLPMICAGVFIGTAGWVVTFAGLLCQAGARRRNRWLAAADAAGGLTLLAYALAALLRLIRPFL